MQTQVTMGCPQGLVSHNRPLFVAPFVYGDVTDVLNKNGGRKQSAT